MQASDNSRFQCQSLSAVNDSDLLLYCTQKVCSRRENPADFVLVINNRSVWMGSHNDRVCEAVCFGKQPKGQTPPSPPSRCNKNGLKHSRTAAGGLCVWHADHLPDVFSKAISRTNPNSSVGRLQHLLLERTETLFFFIYRFHSNSTRRACLTAKINRANIQRK